MFVVELLMFVAKMMFFMKMIMEKMLMFFVKRIMEKI